MGNRRKRIEEIIDIIKNQCVGSQEELAAILVKKGHAVTQATLSRDLKMLRTTKVATDRGTYMYVLPDSDSFKDRLISGIPSSGKLNFQSGFISLDISQNIVVIKTRNGYAPGIAYDIDTRNNPLILGTIPGADTIFAVLKEGVSKEEALALFSEILSIDLSDHSI